MRYITEQELQFQYRQKKLSELVLNSDERLTCLLYTSPSPRDA